MMDIRLLRRTIVETVCLLGRRKPDSKDTMNTNCVLELSPGGNELFGRAWNKETESEEDGE